MSSRANSKSNRSHFAAGGDNIYIGDGKESPVELLYIEA
jgi:hypothetical protein